MVDVEIFRRGPTWLGFACLMRASVVLPFMKQWLVSPVVRPLPPKSLGVRRSVGDFINYGMDSFKFKSVEGELTVRGMLHPKSLGTYVPYPSGRAMGGYISRAMEAAELGHMYGLPTWLSQKSLDLLDCFDALVPIQMLDGCLRLVLRA